MKTAAFLVSEMERLNAAGIAVFMIRGNHDAESVLTRELEFSSNVSDFLDLSRFRAAPSARLSHLSFESDRAFPAQC